MDSASRLYLEGLGGKRLKCCCLFSPIIESPNESHQPPDQRTDRFFCDLVRGWEGRGAEKSCEELSCGLLPVTPDDCRHGARDGRCGGGAGRLSLSTPAPISSIHEEGGEIVARCLGVFLYFAAGLHYLSLSCSYLINRTVNQMILQWLPNFLFDLITHRWPPPFNCFYCSVIFPVHQVL